MRGRCFRTGYKASYLLFGWRLLLVVTILSSRRIWWLQRSIGTQSINGHLRKSLPQHKNISCMSAIIKVSVSILVAFKGFIYWLLFNLFPLCCRPQIGTWCLLQLFPGDSPLSFYQQHFALQLFITHNQWSKNNTGVLLHSTDNREDRMEGPMAGLHQGQTLRAKSSDQF